MKSDWISVENELPEDGIAVLCYGFPSGPIVAWHYDVGNKWIDTIEEYEHYSIDYWMPIPKIPED